MNEMKINNNEIKIYFIILILKYIVHFHLITMHIFKYIYFKYMNITDLII